MTVTARTIITEGGRPAAYLEAGQGRPVVLVHGAGGRGGVWTPQLAGLPDAARLIAVDLPGHGATGGPGCRRVDDYAAWLLGVMDRLALDRVVLAGHSMGGAIAQTVALARVDRLSGLVLVGTGARLRVLPRVLELFETGSPMGADLVGSLAFSPGTAAATMAEADQALRETPAAVTLGDFLACDRFDMMAAVPEIRVPTLVLVGRDDRLTPPKYARFLAGAIPAAHLVEVEAAGHFPQLEQPADVNRALRTFLGRLA